jgi:hypothetical protein
MLSENLKIKIKNNFTCWFFCAWNLLPDIMGALIEDIWEQEAEKNIWT